MQIRVTYEPEEEVLSMVTGGLSGVGVLCTHEKLRYGMRSYNDADLEFSGSAINCSNDIRIVNVFATSQSGSFSY